MLQQRLADGECRILLLHVQRLGEDAGADVLLAVFADVAKEHGGVQQHQCTVRIGGKRYEDCVFLIRRIAQVMDMSGRITPTTTGESEYQHKYQNLDSVFHIYIYTSFLNHLHG